MFVVHFCKDGTADYVGDVYSEASGLVRIQVCSAVLMVGAGLWELTDEIVEVPRGECRFFISEKAAAASAFQANRQIGT